MPPRSPDLPPHRCQGSPRSPGWPRSAVPGTLGGHRIGRRLLPRRLRGQPELVHRFYNERRRQLPGVQPNAAHRAIARLQREYPGRVTLVTQNVDDLLERGGSPEVIHLHGNTAQGPLRLLQARPRLARRSHRRDELRRLRLRICVPTSSGLEKCPWPSTRSLQPSRQCGLFAAIGTSGLVYPAADGFVELAHRHGARCLEFNLEATPASPHFHESRIGPAGQTLPAWVEEQLAPFQNHPVEWTRSGRGPNPLHFPTIPSLNRPPTGGTIAVMSGSTVFTVSASSPVAGLLWLPGSSEPVTRIR